MHQMELDDWITNHQIPNDLRTRIHKFLEYKWIATNGVEDEMILTKLPADLRRDIKKYLCLEFVQQVSGFLVIVNYSPIKTTILYEGRYYICGTYIDGQLRGILV
jgi:hypothetical protein